MAVRSRSRQAFATLSRRLSKLLHADADALDVFCENFLRYGTRKKPPVHFESCTRLLGSIEQYGAELRAGERSVSVAPSNGDFTPDQLQVLLPGDAVGPWRLQAIDGSAAVFQAGDQTRRVAIP